MHSQTGNQPRKQHKDDSVAQLVEQMTLNHWVVGSSPTGVTTREIAFRQSLFLCLRIFYYPVQGLHYRRI